MLTAWADADEGHRKRVETARQVITDALARSRRPYVAFSGGKDSTCMLHLVLQQAPGVTVFHWDYGWYFIPRWLEQEFVDNARAIGATNLIVRATGSPKPYFGLSEMFGVINELFVKQGYDLAFVGLRAEESLKRKRRIARQQSLIAIRECWPIAEWTWKDVWAYIFNHNLPYASVYGRYAPLVGLENVRLSTFFDREFEKIGAPTLDGVLMWRDRHSGNRTRL